MSADRQTNELNRHDWRDWLRFILPSALGVLVFLVPFTVNGAPNIGIGWLSDTVEKALERWLPLIVTLTVTVSALGSLAVATLKPIWPPGSARARLFRVSWAGVGLRLLGALLCWMVLTAFGPEWIISDDTGGVILNDLMTVIFVMFVFAALLLPLLTDFGLMEIVGTQVRPIFRRVFRLPGRASIDAVASWLGSSPVGIILTIDQYERGFYTAREASVLAASFSVVSVAFTVVVADFVGLMEVFIPFYATVCLAGIVAAIALPRLPPLRAKPDDRMAEFDPADDERPPAGTSLLRHGTELALRRAASAPPQRELARRASFQVLDIWLALEPLVMVIGTFGLALAIHTPLFDWISLPMRPVLELLRLPEAAAAAPAMVVGFADQFLPAILAESIESEKTRFVLACMSVLQLVYMSEVGALLLKSKLPIGMGDLVAIFAWRTVLTLPVCALAAHLLF